MRSLLTTLSAVFLLSGCSLVLPSEAKPMPEPTPTADPSTWVMGPDSFGPITMETTRAQALATGHYRPAPSPCSTLRVDWRGQNYEKDETGRRTLVKPHLASITFTRNGDVKYIDPGKDSATDVGIRRADSLSRLMLTYGDELIPALDQTTSGGTFAVSGDRSHLLYVVMYGKVIGFYIAAGHVDEPEEVEPLAGKLTKPDAVRPGRGGPC
jgi:hypothetical protein